MFNPALMSCGNTSKGKFYMKKLKLATALFVCAGGFGLAMDVPASAVETGNEKVAAKAKKEEMKDAKERVDKASEALREIMGDADKAIPKDLMEKAQAVVVFPGSTKAAFIFGGKSGGGLVVRRTENGWTAPAFLNMGGACFGAQIGVNKTDYIMLVMNEQGLNNLLADKFEIGGEAGVAAGPVGRTAAASTSATLDAAILTYSRSRGAFAGVSLKGTVISQDETMNQSIYGKSAKEILFTPVRAVEAPADLQKFPATVENYGR
jgi:lipid-binding SYLF domain-containing protein